MYPDMSKRMFVWAVTSTGFKHRMEAYPVHLQERDKTGEFLGSLVLRHGIRWHKEYGENVMLLKPYFVLQVAETGQKLRKIKRINRANDLCLTTLVPNHFGITSTTRYKFDEAVQRLDTLPIITISPRVVRMPDGWYTVCGTEAGPFKSKDSAVAALSVMTGIEYIKPIKGRTQ